MRFAKKKFFFQRSWFLNLRADFSLFMDCLPCPMFCFDFYSTAFSCWRSFKIISLQIISFHFILFYCFIFSSFLFFIVYLSFFFLLLFIFSVANSVLQYFYQAEIFERLLAFVKKFIWNILILLFFKLWSWLLKFLMLP